MYLVNTFEYLFFIKKEKSLYVRFVLKGLILSSIIV